MSDFLDRLLDPHTAAKDFTDDMRRILELVTVRPSTIVVDETTFRALVAYREALLVADPPLKTGTALTFQGIPIERSTSEGSHPFGFLYAPPAAEA